MLYEDVPYVIKTYLRLIQQNEHKMRQERWSEMIPSGAVSLFGLFKLKMSLDLLKEHIFSPNRPPNSAITV